MGKRILLVWEGGAGMGHQLKLSWMAAALRAKGHETVFAARRPEQLATTEPASRVVPTPRWPGMKNKPARHWDSTSTGPLDNFGRLGMAEPGAVETTLRAWDLCLQELKPNAIVADSAPGCLCAARGRIPTMAVGEGFSLPPPTLEHFPVYLRDGRQSLFEESELLGAVNAGLRATGRDQLDRLSQIYASDRAGVGTFQELDPYRNYRTAVMAPWLPEWEGGVEMQRQELFAYLSFNARARRTTLAALARAAARGLPVTLHIPNMDQKTRNWLAATKIRVEAEPLTLKELQSRAAMILSLGSLGLVSFALAAGIPQIVIPNTIANQITGETVETLGVGKLIKIAGGDEFEPILLAQTIERIYSDSTLTARAIARAPDFIGRAFPRTAEVAASMVEELL